MRSSYQTLAKSKTTLAWLAIASLSTAHLSAQEEPLRDALPRDDFVIREEMIPMRDGAKLYTLIISPKEIAGKLPIILRRTPYDCTGVLRGHASTRLDVNIGYEFLGDDYIYVVQDIRGRFKSEGDYFMYRAPRGEFNSIFRYCPV